MGAQHEFRKLKVGGHPFWCPTYLLVFLMFSAININEFGFITSLCSFLLQILIK